MNAIQPRFTTTRLTPRLRKSYSSGAAIAWSVELGSDIQGNEVASGLTLHGGIRPPAEPLRRRVPPVEVGFPHGMQSRSRAVFSQSQIPGPFPRVSFSSSRGISSETRVPLPSLRVPSRKSQVPASLEPVPLPAGKFRHHDQPSNGAARAEKGHNPPAKALDNSRTALFHPIFET